MVDGSSPWVYSTSSEAGVVIDDRLSLTLQTSPKGLPGVFGR